MTIFSINSGSFGDVTVTGIVSASTLKGDGSQITSVSYDNIASKPTLISSSTQVEALLPGGTISSSLQINTGSFSGSFTGQFIGTASVAQTALTASYISGGISITNGLDITGSLGVTGAISAQSFTGSVLSTNGVVSSSGQVTISSTTGYTSFSSSLATIDTAQTSRLTAIENVTGSYATTGSNTFVAPQTISDTTDSTNYLDGALHVAGGMSVRKDVRISGSMTVNGLLTAVSMSTQYVTSSQYVVGDNKIILSADDVTRFGGMSIVDSGSSSPATASIYWDSLKHKFIYENLSGSAYNSAIFIAGPKNTGSLGDEVGLTSGYIPVATGDDHIDNSVMYQTSGNVGIGTTGASEKLYVQGNVFATGKYSTSNADGYNVQLSGGNAYRMYANINDLVFRSVTAGLDVLTLAYGGNVGIGTTIPEARLDVRGNLLVDAFNQGDETGIFFRSGFISSDKYNVSILVKDYNGNAADGLSINGYDGIGFCVGSNSRNEVMRIKGGSSGGVGNVGIGTTNPTVNLDVENSSGWAGLDLNGTSGGEIRLQKNGITYGQIYASEGSSTGFIINAAGSGNDMYFQSNGTTVVTILDTSNVGIRETNPSLPLHVAGVQGYPSSSGTTEVGYITLRNKSAGSTHGMWMGVSNIAPYGSWIQAADAGNFATSYPILINPNGGNVGVGTTNPSSKLSVNGDVAILSGNSLYFLNSVNSGNGSIVCPGGGSLSIRSYGTEMIGLSENTTLLFSTNGSEKMRVTVSGSVGIGTASPVQKLHIEGSAAIGTTGTEDILILGRSLSGAVSFQQAASLKLGRYQNAGGAYESYTRLDFALRDNSAASNYNTNTTVMTLTNASRVGINTTNPISTLNINGYTGGTVGSAIASYNKTFVIGGEYNQTYNTGSNVLFLIADYSNDAPDDVYPIYVEDENNIVDFFLNAGNTGTAESKRAYFGGNVGIGTTNPTNKLQVNGTFNVTSTTGDVAYIGSTFATAPIVGRILHLRDDKATTLVDSFISIGWTSSPGQDAYAGKRTTANAGYFAIQNSSGNEIFTIDLANQRVGIGATDPQAKLAVTQNGTTAQAIHLYNNNSTNLRYSEIKGQWTSTDVSHTAAIRFLKDVAVEGQYGSSIGFVTELAQVSQNIDYAMYIKNRNVGIGTTSPNLSAGAAGSTYLTVSTSTSGRNSVLELNGARTTTGEYTGYVRFFNNVAATPLADIQAIRAGTDTTGSLAFATTNVERARITSAGEFLVGTTTGALTNSTNGFVVEGTTGEVKIFRASNAVLIANRNTDDGTIISIRQANVEEGTIAVSGTTVSYNGGHLARWSQLTDNTRIPLLKGTVMSNLDQMAEWIDPETGLPQQNEQLNCMKVSDVEGDLNVAGVFVNWDDDDETFTSDMNIAMTGDMIIRIAQDVTVQRGDLLISAGDGTAKPQTDDIIRGNTIAKVTSTHVTCTYEDGSYCVPCVLMAC